MSNGECIAFTDGDVEFHADEDGNPFSVFIPSDHARLISAAPDLLAAVEEAVEWDSHDSEGEPAVWLERARAAIRKARP